MNIRRRYNADWLDCWPARLLLAVMAGSALLVVIALQAIRGPRRPA